MQFRHKSKWIALVGLVTAVSVLYYWNIEHRGMKVQQSKSLSKLVLQNSSYDIVFTSRTEAASLQPAAPEAEPYQEPIQIPWAASHGRLRLLDTNNRLWELTWGQQLPDGSTIIDVMSPSVSLDGERILFAGRNGTRARWRIYEVRLDGSGLKQLTGGPDDPGCMALPPLRFRADGTRISDFERMKIDYDDVDPTDLGPNGFAFASSRLPDLGRDHSRRATQIWSWSIGDKSPKPLTANRNNDRWPVLMAGDQILFSLWSRNREAVTADLSELKPVSMGGQFATRPTDNWMANVIMANAAQFGYAIKSVEPVWRPRPLFNGRIAFMTSMKPDSPLKLVQADWGYIRTAPSSLAAGESMPYEGGAQLDFGPIPRAANSQQPVHPLLLIIPLCSARLPLQQKFSRLGSIKCQMTGPRAKSFLNSYLTILNWSMPNPLPLILAASFLKSESCQLLMPMATSSPKVSHF